MLFKLNTRLLWLANCRKVGSPTVAAEIVATSIPSVAVKQPGMPNIPDGHPAKAKVEPLATSLLHGPPAVQLKFEPPLRGVAPGSLLNVRLLNVVVTVPLDPTNSVFITAPWAALEVSETIRTIEKIKPPMARAHVRFIFLSFA